jgi:ATP-dependent RNA helicase RhlE
VLFTDFSLDERLMAGIRKAGYTQPTPIQQNAIPAVVQGRDLIATAQTGTGKTAAFVLPVLHRLLNLPARRGTRVLVLTPTRELALQIQETVETLAEGTGIKAATVFGGVGANPQIQALRKGVDVVIACPGRLLDLHKQGEVDFAQLDHFILDEADRMFDMGFLPEVRRIIALLPAQRQNLLFSATFPPEIEALAASLLRDPQRVKVGISRPAHTVAHALYPVSNHLKTNLLLHILKRTDSESMLVFTRTKHRAKRLAQKLEREGYKVTALHGNRSQTQRQDALGGFKSGKYQIMVATDIAARGIDVSSITHVINFDMPDTADAYIHRIGRTGRAERNGDAYTLVCDEDRDMIRLLEKIMGSPLERKTFPDFDYKAAAPAEPLEIPLQERLAQHRAQRQAAREKAARKSGAAVGQSSGTVARKPGRDAAAPAAGKPRHWGGGKRSSGGGQGRRDSGSGRF